METASSAYGLSHSSPEIAFVGRAHRGRRSKSAPRFLGTDTSTGRPGADVSHHDALHGRSRAMPAAGLYFQGKLLAAGTVDEVISGVGLTTWSVGGPDLAQLVEQLRKTPGVQ